jgi:uncharacterized membrane protein
MTADISLTIAHHLLVFSLAGVIAFELATVRRGMNATSLRTLGIVDLHYGVLAGLILVVGSLGCFSARRVRLSICRTTCSGRRSPRSPSSG